VVRAIINNGTQLSREQLAGALGQSPSSGAFILKVSAARQFGLIDSKDSKFQATDLGFSIIDKNETREKQSKVQAFLNVPLYKKIYEDFKGKQLPPRPFGLENTLAQMGVAPKQKSNARLAFEKSARQAGFFNVDPDRLIQPVLGVVIDVPPATPHVKQSPIAAEVTSSPNNSRPKLDPLIEGLLSRLPEPGSLWAADIRKRWLQTLEANLEMIYPLNGDDERSNNGSSL
jgi:hypothetical protein